MNCSAKSSPRCLLRASLISYLRRIEQAFHIGFKPFKDYSRFKEIIKQVNDAVLKLRVIEMRYYSMSSKRETTRKVDPYKVRFFNRTLYLIGWCHVHDEIRMFVLDRIKLLHVTKERFIPPNDFDLDEYMKDCFGVIHTDVEKVVIRFDAPLEKYLKENIWHPSQVFKKQKDGSLLLTMEVGGLVEVMSWVLVWRPSQDVQFCSRSRQARILPTGIVWYFEDENLSLAQRLSKRGCFAMVSFGRQAEVLEPEHLRKAVAEELVATAEKYTERPELVYQEGSKQE